jgi:hypothetical protein
MSCWLGIQKCMICAGGRIKNLHSPAPLEADLYIDDKNGGTVSDRRMCACKLWA